MYCGVVQSSVYNWPFQGNCIAMCPPSPPNGNEFDTPVLSEGMG